MKGFFKVYLIPVLIASVFVVLAGLTIFVNLYQTKVFRGELIQKEIAELVDIFKRIDKSCHIIDFDYQQNRINFLNIKKDGFVGSEVGSMNLTYPEKWDGPYLDDNPTIQEQEYLVINTKYGHFITPGIGVKLPNGKVIGKDIKIDQDADIPALMVDKNGLVFQGKALAAPLPLLSDKRVAIRLPAGY